MINKSCHMTHQLYSMIEKIKELCRRECIVHISHTHCEGNRVTDKIAASALDGILDLRLLDEPLKIVSN